jgi:uncharacterized membrane protein YfcA
MEYAGLMLAGLLAGVLGGLLGVGGSVIMLPAMLWLLGSRNAAGGERIHEYMAAAMIVNCLLSIPAVVAHIRRKAVWRGVWLPLSIAGAVGIVAGVQLSWLFSGDAAMYLRWILGGFFAYVAAQNLWRLARPPRQEGLSQSQVEAGPLWRRGALGLAMGSVAGLTGIGGGALVVPLQQIILKMPLRNAIATSAATIASIAWVGALAKNIQLGPATGGSVAASLTLAAVLALPAMIGSYIGGHLTHALPVPTVRAFFALLMLASSAKTFWG